MAQVAGRPRRRSLPGTLCASSAPLHTDSYFLLRRPLAENTPLGHLLLPLCTVESDGGPSTGMRVEVLGRAREPSAAHARRGDPEKWDRWNTRPMVAGAVQVRC